MLKARKPLVMNGNGASLRSSSENDGLSEPRREGEKGEWGVIELSSSSETDDEKTGCQQKTESGRMATKTAGECWNRKGEKPINMLRRDYGKRAPCRTFQVPTLPTLNNIETASGQEEFYKYLGITKPPFAKAVDMSTDFIKRRSLRMCFLKKWKEHRAKLAELEKDPVDIVENNPVSPVPVKTPSPNLLAELSPASSHSSGRTMERWDYIQINNSASDEENNVCVKHKVSDLSHPDVEEKSIRGGKTEAAKKKEMKPLKRKTRKKITKKIFYSIGDILQKKYKYFSRSKAVASSLRSGKVRETDMQKIILMSRLRKTYKKRNRGLPHVAQEIPTPKVQPAKPLEVIELTDDDDEVEENVQINEEKSKEKFLDDNLGQVIGVYVSWPSLLIIQEQIISFWSCPRMASVFNNGEQKWEKEGEIKRKTYDDDIPAAVNNRILHSDNFGCVYVEMRGHVQEKIHTQGPDYTTVYINLYYMQKKEGFARSIELDRIVSLPKEICCTTLPDLLSFVVTWYEYASPIKRRTGICRYSLTPDLETLASIWDFNSVDNRVLSLSVATEQRVVGIGDHHVSIWNYSNGNLLTNIEFPLELGDNLFYHLEHDNKRRFIFLTQLHADTIQTVAINLLDFQYLVLHIHKNVNLTKDALSSSTFNHGIFVAVFNTSEVLVLKAHKSDFMKCKTVDKNTNIYLCNEHVVEISDRISVHNFLDLII
ncbi:hypothetical protein DMENIID0001_085900 [Sergentomyia squamirostris]